MIFKYILYLCITKSINKQVQIINLKIKNTLKKSKHFFTCCNMMTT